MPLFYYLVAGLKISSELEIPEWAVFEQQDHHTEWDVTILLGAPAAIQPSGTNISVDGDDYYFVIPDTATYRVRQGREILITPQPEVGLAELRLFLLGSAWGGLCYQRGLLALHMSVVQVGAQAVAFCGPAGAGKSSMAAGLVAGGYPLLADDLVCIDFNQPLPRVFPSVPRLKLWREALDYMGLDAQDLQRDHFRLDKYHVTSAQGLQTAAAGELLPLRAIYLLEWGEPGLTRLKGLQGLQRLVSSATYRPDLLTAMDRNGFYWEECAQLARSVQIWELRRARDWDRMPEVVAMLRASWQTV